MAIFNHQNLEILNRVFIDVVVLLKKLILEELVNKPYPIRLDRPILKI